MTPVVLRVGDSTVAEYVIAAEVDPTLAPRPYLHPVRTKGGTVVTDVQPADHPWHLGVGVAMPDVAGANLWGGRSYVAGQGYVWLPDHGRIEHIAWREQTPGAVTHDLAWQGPQGATLLAERRTVRAVATATGWRLTLALRLTNPGDTAVALRSPAVNGRGDGAGYGGFFWRLPTTSGLALAAGPLRGERDINGSAWPELTVRGRAADGRYALTFSGLAGDDRWFVRAAEYPAVGVAFAFERPLVIEPAETIQRVYSVVVSDD
jgi:Methane oxygenase PmoA